MKKTFFISKKKRASRQKYLEKQYAIDFYYWEPDRRFFEEFTDSSKKYFIDILRLNKYRDKHGKDAISR